MPSIWEEKIVGSFVYVTRADLVKISKSRHACKDIFFFNPSAIKKADLYVRNVSAGRQGLNGVFSWSLYCYYIATVTAY